MESEKSVCFWRFFSKIYVGNLLIFFIVFILMGVCANNIKTIFELNKRENVSFPLKVMVKYSWFGLLLFNKTVVKSMILEGSDGGMHVETEITKEMTFCLVLQNFGRRTKLCFITKFTKFLVLAPSWTMIRIPNVLGVGQYGLIHGWQRRSFYKLNEIDD